MNKESKVFHHSKWERLVSPDRQERMDPQKFFDAVKPGRDSIWADIGCGPGFFTIPLASLVRKVLAVDISQEMLDICRQRAAGEDRSNIEYIRVTDEKLPIDDASVDALLLAAIYHEYDDHATALSELERILRPGGSLYIIDWKYEEMDVGPPLDHRIPDETVLHQVEENGFRAEPALNLYELLYVLPFRKES